MITLTKFAESVTPLKESLLGKTKDKVADIAAKSASELAADLGFPREDQLNYATGGVVYYTWWYRPLIEENEKEIKEFLATYKYPAFRWPADPSRFDSYGSRIEIYVKVIPFQLHRGAPVNRFVEVGFQQSTHQRLRFCLTYIGGSKKSVIQKAYRLLEYIRDEEGLLTDIIKASTKQEDASDVAERLVKKYNIKL